jgi:branched-chain amino acid transport system permease protein
MLQGFGQYFMVRILAVVGLYVMLALGLNIVVGYAGLLDLGYIAFYAMGAYGGVLIAAFLQSRGINLGQWTYYAMLPIGAAAAACTGIALGAPVLRLRGDYLAIVTLGFGEIVRILLVNNFLGITNGAKGVGLPDGAGSPWPLEQLKALPIITIPGTTFAFKFSDNLFWYFIVVLLSLLTIFVVRRLNDSRLGRSWVAMREDEVAASSVGINLTVAKLWAFSLGAMWGGIAGVTFGWVQGFVTPESFTFMESVFVVAMVVIGGMGSIPGAIVGALVIQGIPELIRGLAAQNVFPFSLMPPAVVSLIPNYRFLIFGLVMVIMMILRPQGIIPSQRRARELKPEDPNILAEENEDLYDVQHGDGMSGGDKNF